MSADGSISLTWADGEHRFRLAIGQLRELQDKCAAGPAAILDRLRTGMWYVDDLREVLRLGLIGGGLKPAEAYLLVKRYVEERPLLESRQPAMTVLMAALIGVPEDPVSPGKPEAERAPTEADASPSPPSTASVVPSAGAPAT